MQATPVQAHSLSALSGAGRGYIIPPFHDWIDTMVAYGTVKFFNREAQYGFITVTDQGGIPTGEEVHFHYLNGQYPRYIGSELRLSGSTNDDSMSRLEFPHGGDFVVWERDERPSCRDIVKWSYRKLWNSMSELGTIHPLNWRIVQKRWEGDEFAGLTGTTHSPVCRVASETVVKSGACSVAKFFGAMGGGMSPQLYWFDITETDGERYTYELQLKREEGGYTLERAFWLFVRLMVPVLPLTIGDEYLSEPYDDYEGEEPHDR